jgi:hypothetical protein
MKSWTIIIACLVLAPKTCDKNRFCDKGHNALTFQNRSTRTINFEFYWNYPDTSIGEYNPLNDGTNGLKPGEFFLRGAGPRSCWEAMFSRRVKEWIYIFDEDTIRNLSWNVVRKSNRGLLERRLLTIDYLQKNNFIVSFPDREP